MAKPKAPKYSKEDEQLIALTDKFYAYARPAGMPVDQIQNFLCGGLLYLPQPKQCEMHAAARAADYRCPECQAKYQRREMLPKECVACGPLYIGVGGARGGGKSAFTIGQVCIDDVSRLPGSSWLYLRKTAKAMVEQIRKLLFRTLPKGSYNYREQRGLIEFANGSVITIGHFKDESEIENYIGQEFDGIAIEELTTLTQSKFENVTSCLRTSKPGWRPRVYASWNWGGIGHLWVKKMFYDPWKEKREIQTRYILALVSDNSHIDPEAAQRYSRYTGWKYQSWFLGNPDINAGNFFTTFSPDVHVYPNSTTTLDESKIVRWFGSMDYGSSHPNCFHLHCETENGDCFTVFESWTLAHSISENAELFRDGLRLRNLDPMDLQFIAAGHDVRRGDRKTREDGSTVETEYAECGIQLTPSMIDRVNAWSQLQERLGNPDRGTRPSWYIHRSCHQLIEWMQRAQYDEKHPNDIKKENADLETGEGGDDAGDSARNGIVMAFDSLLSTAQAIPMGSYRSPNQPMELEGQTIDVSAVVILRDGSVIEAGELTSE